MRVIKLSKDDEEMETRDDVLSFFNVELRRKSRVGKFGLTPAKQNLSGIRAGVLLLFTYQTECMFLAQAGGEIVHPANRNAYFVVDIDSIFPVYGRLADYEKALAQVGLSKKQLVNTQAWPILPDTCEAFTVAYFNYPLGQNAKQIKKRMEMQRRLHAAMLNLFRQAGKETGYWGTRYLQSVKRHGGLATAQRMLQPRKGGKIDQGLLAMIEAGRADELSVEAMVSRPEFRELFTDQELREASRRLRRIPLSARQRPVPPESNFSDSLGLSTKYIEGAVRHVLVNAYERNPKARAACLARHGYECMVCGLSFEDVYGEIGR